MLDVGLIYILAGKGVNRTGDTSAKRGQGARRMQLVYSRKPCKRGDRARFRLEVQ